MLSKSIYLFMSKVVGYGVRIILPIFLVRQISKEEFGLYNQFFLLEILIQTVFQLGISQTLYYFVPRDEENAGAYLLNCLLMNVVIYVGAYTLIWFLKDQIALQLGMKVVLDYFWYLAGYSLLMLLNVTIIAYLTARQRIASASLMNILWEVLASIGTLFAAFTYRDVQKIILALVIARGVSFLIGVLYVHLKLKGFQAQRYLFGILDQFRYGAVLGFGGTIWVYSLRLHELVVSRYYDLETYAVYAAGCKQIPFLHFFAQSIAAVALGRFAVLVKEQKWEEVQELWHKILGIMYGAAIPIVAGLLLISRPLVLAMFTADYAEAIPIFRWNTLVYLAMIINSSLILRALNRNDVILRTNGAMFVLLVISLHFGRKLGGLQGIIAVHFLIQILTRIVTQAQLNRLCPVTIAYFPPLSSIWAFYAGVLTKTRDFCKRATSWAR